MRYLNAYHYLAVPREADLDADGLTACCAWPASGSPLRCEGCDELVAGR